MTLTLKLELSQLPQGAQQRLGNTTGKNCFEVFQSKSTGLGEWGEGVEPRGPAFVLPLTCWVS